MNILIGILLETLKISDGYFILSIIVIIAISHFLSSIEKKRIEISIH